MREVSISQLWGRAWYLFKVNWLLFVGLYVLLIIVTFISINALIFGLILSIFTHILSPFFIVGLIGFLIVPLILTPAFVRAGYLVARKGQSSFGEAFGDLSLLLKVFVYDLILRLIPGILTGMGVYRVLESVVDILAAAPPETKKDYGAMIVSMMLGETGGVLIGAGLVIFFILYLFGWAGPYAILSGRAGIFGAIGESFSLTAQNFGKVFLALLSYIGLLIFVPISGRVVSLQRFYIAWILMGYLIVLPMGFVFLPLLYLALTGEKGASHA
jgi:hypothetical protein